MEMVDHAVEMTHELFDYNRENFFFDQEQGIEREYQEQDMRVKQFVLYREDIRDLVELTTGKMDAYMPPIVFELGIAFLMLVHGEMDDPDEIDSRRAPAWLFWLYAVNLAESFLYLFLAAWFCSHASICAHSFGVRLLTQYVRLPVPNKAQLDAARRYAAEFEGTAMLRVPVVRQQAERLADHRQALLDAETSDADAGNPMLNGGNAMAQLQDLCPNVMTLNHIKVYRKLQSNWQAHDAYCRACVSLGTYCLVHAIAYFLIGYFVVELDAPGPAMSCAIMLVSLAWLLVKLDLYFRKFFFVIAAFLLMSGPVLAVISITLQRSTLPKYYVNCHYALVPIIYMLQALLILAITYVSRAEQINATGATESKVALPTRFRTVLYLDVFGWLADPQSEPQAPVDVADGDASSHGTMAMRATPIPLPQWQNLLREMCTITNDVRQRLRAWTPENQAVTQKIREHFHIHLLSTGLNDTFDYIMAELHSISTSDCGMANVMEQQASLAGPDRDFWLLIHWEDERNEVEYFVNATTGECRDRVDLPRDACISDLRELEESMNVLNVQVVALKDADPRRAAAEDFASETSGSFFGRIGERLARRSRDASPHAHTGSRSNSTASETTSSSFLRAISPPARLGAVDHSSGIALSPIMSAHVSLERTRSSSPVASTQSVLQRGATFTQAPFSRATTQQSTMSRASTFGGSPVTARYTRTGSTFGATRSSVTFEPEPLLVHGPASNAQETGFGGREAANLESTGNRFATNAAAAQTFYPREDNRAQCDVLPGQVPWKTFCAASTVLMAVWMVGCLFYTLHPFYDTLFDEIDRGGLPDGVLPNSTLSGAQLVFSADRWPVRPTSMHLVGMACDASLSGQLLVAEQYGIYQIAFDDHKTGEAAHERSIEDCLAQVPEFHSEGLKGISLECNSRGNCSALLLGKQGTQVLQCELGKAHRNRLSTSVHLAHRSGLPGWGAIAVGADSKGSSKYWWGLQGNRDSSPRKLSVQCGNTGNARAFPVGSLHLKSSTAGDTSPGNSHAVRGSGPRRQGSVISRIQQLQIYDESVLLGLGSNGHAIHTWQIQASYPSDSEQLQTSLHIGSWRIPGDLHAEAFCVSGKQLFIGGRALGSSSGPEVWRFDLPAQVLALASANSKSLSI